MTAKPTPIKPPDHLSATMKAWFASVVREFVLDDHHVLLLAKACEAWDRADTARQAIEANGLTYLDRFDVPRSRPEIAIERDSRLAFARLLRELNLDVSPPPEVRPPRIGGRKQ